VSIWEAFLLVKKNRLQISGDYETWLNQSLNALPVVEAPVTFEVTRVLSTIVLPHEDPADLFLAATAKAFGLTLVTADHNLLKIEGVTILAN
jgi:PIN domain nuclease of toxin-antitoxin system